jgi:hypothetical protein
MAMPVAAADEVVRADLAADGAAQEDGSAPRKEKGQFRRTGLFPESIGRGGGIRTRDPLHPMQVRYQAAPRPDEAAHYKDTSASLE